MSPSELEGVLGHEIAHIANGDMVTMTLVQGVINAFVMFLARVLAFALSGLGKNNQRSSTGSYYMFVFIFELIFMVLGMLVIAAYSRYREFRADRGGAKFAGKESMISALVALKRSQEVVDERYEKPAFQAFKISNPKRHGIRQLFATHPPLETRIERLRVGAP
jgi:heat shock protein HtpX